MMMSEHVDKKIQKYITENCIRLNPTEKKLQDQINKDGGVAGVVNECCSADCGQLMRVLIKGINARKCLEIGSLTGLATLSMAMALPTDGQIVTLNNVEKHCTTQMKTIWKEGGVDNKVHIFYVYLIILTTLIDLTPKKIQCRVGETIEQLEKLKTETGLGKWDLIVVNNVDKNIKNVVDKCLGLLRPGGMIAINHILWNGYLN